MIRKISIWILFLLILSGCNKNKANTADTKPMQNESSSNSDEQIRELLESTEITISGVYGNFEKDSNTVVRGNEIDNRKEFNGFLTDISSIKTVVEDQRIIVYCLANVDGQLFKTLSPCEISVIIEKDSENKLYISKTSPLEDALPDITPSVPFDVNYIFEPSGSEQNKIRFQVTGKEFDADKDLYTIDGATIEYDQFINGRDAGGTYFITIPVNKEHIKDLEMVYRSANAIEYRHIYLIATLSNGLKIYGSPKISYVPTIENQSLEKPADYWRFYLDITDTWELDSKRRK